MPTRWRRERKWAGSLGTVYEHLAYVSTTHRARVIGSQAEGWGWRAERWVRGSWRLVESGHTQRLDVAKRRGELACREDMERDRSIPFVGIEGGA